MRRFVAVLALACLPILPAAGLASTVSANGATATNNTVEYHLKNGLTVIVRENHRAPVVLSSIWYKVGGAYEHDGITGISHVLEHMMFEGTKKYGPGVFNTLISENGGRQNAMTSQDWTMYYQQISADKLPLIFKLEADRMRGLLLQPKRFKKELQVVMEERRMRVDDNPQGLTWERFKAAALVNNPYHHPVVGWMTDIKHLTLQDTRRWYDKWYVPNNAIVVVVGDVKPAQVLKLAQQYFGPLKRGDVPKLKPRTEVPPLGERQVSVTAPAKLPWLVMGYNTPSLVTAKQKWQPYALMVLAYVLAGTNSSRLERDMVRGKSLAVSVGVDYSPLELHSDVFVLTATPTVKHTIAQNEQAILAQIANLQTKLVSTAELDSIKAQLTAQQIYGQDSLMRQAFMLGLPTVIGLPWQVGDQYIDRIKQVTPEQVRAVAQEYLVPKRLTIAILKPKKIVTVAKKGVQP